MADPAGTLALSVAQSRPSAHATESAELLHERLRVFVGILGAFLGSLYLAGVILALTFIPEQFATIHLHPAKVANGIVALVLGGIWFLLRRVKRVSLGALQLLDVCVALGIPLTAAFAVPHLREMPEAWNAGYHYAHFAVMLGVLLITVFTLALRAALVPSPPRRTALIGLACALPLVLSAYHVAADDTALSPFASPAIVAIGVGVWSSAITCATTITSRVIYGLHLEVEKTRRLGQYTLSEKLGEGGMGTVYLASHAMLRRPTAVKLLRPDRAGLTSLARFEREVQLTSMLTHPNTIAVYDFGRTSEGVFYYAMEYVDGLSLEELVRADGPLPAGRVIHLLRQAAGALGEAHRVGLIHRDVKPGNILVCERGGVPDTVKVVDFGLVKELSTNGDVNVTQADAITGTPLYLAPEMITAPHSVDARVDLYALGAVGYFLLTGGPVFDGATMVEVCGHHLHTQPEPPSARRELPLSEELERLILECLAKRPDDRPFSAEVLEAQLNLLGQIHPWTVGDAGRWWIDWRRGHPRAAVVGSMPSPPAAAS